MEKNESIKKAVIRKTAKEAGMMSNRLSTYLDLPMNEDAEVLILDDDLEESLKTLLYPGNISNISITTRGDGVANTVVCVDVDSCVVAGMEKEDVFLEKMATEDFVAKLISFLENDAKLQFLETALVFTRNGLYALLSTVDYLRLNRMLAMLEHEKESLDLNATGIKAMFVDTIEYPDPRWLLANVLMIDSSEEELDLDAGIEELKEIGIFENSENPELSEKGILLTAGLAELEVFCGIQSFYYDAGALTTITLGIFRTRSFIWAIELNENALYALNFDTAALLLFGLLNRGDYSDGPYVEEEVLEEEPTETTCLSCGTKLKAGLKFCTNCGTPMSKSRQTCPNCKAGISENDKFCKKCGQAL